MSVETETVAQAEVNIEIRCIHTEWYPLLYSDFHNFLFSNLNHLFSLLT